MFVLAFDLRRDRNKVLKGGPWRFNQALVVLQEYDGVSPIHEIDLTSLFFWVRIGNIPPLFEEPDMIKSIASVAGKFLEMDDKLFENVGKVRVHVAHDISKPFFLKKTLKLAPYVEVEISYFFENLVGKCDHCNLIYHEGDHWPLIGSHAAPVTTKGMGDPRVEIGRHSLGQNATEPASHDPGKCMELVNVSEDVVSPNRNAEMALEEQTGTPELATGKEKENRGDKRTQQPPSPAKSP
ncbi:uncharacterized protein LOC133730397 [Rosa rugosa]|uniref:uncharacterized protein LOC133730397 n=1 Tax=Rosa rugosa TaxID=74645 RepID=UPI002B40B931|nr:uncharacterized protein LOC133730397 [Rosa rugosa]